MTMQESKVTSTHSPKGRTDLSAARQALLSRLLGGNVKPSVHSGTNAIEPRPADVPAQLSFAQQRLWFLTELEPDSPVFNMPYALRLQGATDVGVLARALNEIVRRHASLRTLFQLVDDQVQQVILPECVLPLPLTDLSRLPADAAQDEARRLAHAESRRPFRLGREVPIRASVIRLAPDECIVLLTLHHIVSDAWSMGVLVKEVATLYAAYAHGEPSPLPELPVQYADFAHWQRQWLTGNVLAQQLDYWKNTLQGAPALLELPTDFPRPPVKTDNGASYECSIDAEVTAGLEALCKEGETTLYMVLLAAFGIVLSRYSGQTDVPIGTAIANRTRSEIEGLVGFFVNTLVMRLNLAGDPRFVDLLAHTRETAMGAYAHQDLPFEHLVESLNPERNMSYSPLFQVSLVMQNTPMGSLQLPGVQVSAAGADNTTAKYDIALNVMAVGDRLSARFEYNTDLFRRETIARLGDHLRVLLGAIVRDPQRRLSELPMLAEAERTRLLRTWNTTAQPYPESCVHRVFEAQCKKTPDAIALSMEGVALSYATLNARANQLARHLQANGAGVDHLIGLCVERSVDMIVSMLAILKAGAAYAPLDADYPPERLAYMAQDAGFDVLICHRHLAGNLPTDSLRTIFIDEAGDDIARHATDDLAVPTRPDNLAYAIYTSGSTGQPKGTCITHRNILRLAFDVEYVSAGPGDTVSQVSNSSFDAATFEIWTALLHGARLHIVPRDTLLSFDDFVACVRNEAISVMCLTPAFFNQVIRAVPDAFAQLRYLLVGGEQMDPAAARQLLRHPPAHFINGYGPTESTTFATTHEVRAVADDAVLIPIGRPIANTRVYLLDRHLQPVPVGVPGELYIAGDGLGRGYLNQPALTAEKFTPDPFGKPGGRLYRTGDRARYLPSGEIECLGRIDHQIKLRGFRIELGEIEARLAELPEVAQALVMVREDTPGDRRLVAYVVPRADPAPDDALAGLLRDALATRLPEYMLPAAYVTVDSMPLTPNGKVDRKALPVPGAAPVSDHYVAPRNAIEETLAMVWNKALKLERIGVHDNFYELGGDSLLSMQVIVYAKANGLSFTPRQIMQHQTIAELATVVQAATVEASTGTAEHGDVPLSPRQRWFFELDVPNPHYHNTWAVREVEAEFEPALMARALDYAAAYHDALRLRFERTGQGWRQYLAEDNAGCAFETLDLTGVPAEHQATEMTARCTAVHASLNLRDGPLLKIVYIKLAEAQPGRLLFIAHHLILDGMGLHILLHDLTKLYRQASRDEDLHLPGKTTSFKSWTERSSERARSPEIRAELARWVSLAAPETRPLPVDYVIGEEDEASARVLEVRLSADETRALVAACERAGLAMNDAVIAAMLKAFNAWTGQRSLLLELSHHGRDATDDMDLTRTVGWLTSNFPLVFSEPAGQGIDDTARAVHLQLAKVPGAGAGYGLLRYASGDLDARQTLESLPQAQVFYNFLGQRTVTKDADSPGRQENFGPHRCPTHHRTWLIYCKGIVMGEELVLQWEYSENRHQRQTIDTLARRCADHLREMGGLAPVQVTGQAPSDVVLE
ncbi:MAG: amino acid adenylation domain-containing protein [Rhodocyclaceae bacterium]